ncbi:MAG: transporter [Rhizobacter sp.]|nr:transporter [Rhizobacter sp.]
MTPASPTSASPSAATPSASLMTPGMVRLFAFVCGVIVANIYYAQPIVALIAPQLGLSLPAASLIVSLTQVGYAVGLFLLVPLGDILENRRLVLSTLGVTVVALVAAATASRPSIFLAAAVLIGLSSVSVQMLIPLAAHLSPEATRGRVVGSVMSGLSLGILLARPASSVVADHFGWRAVFWIAAVSMAGVAVIVARTIPRHEPKGGIRYGALIASLVHLMRSTPVLRERSFFQACMFGAFSLFWTAVPIELARSHGFSQSQIALFALVGAIGVIAGPFGGRAADAGHTTLGTRLALCLAAVALLQGMLPWGAGIVALGITAVVLDFCMQFNMVLGQRAIYSLAPEHRSRLNALYMTSIFIGGATGSAIASPLYSHGGWPWVAAAGGIFPLIAAVKALLRRPMGQGA